MLQVVDNSFSNELIGRLNQKILSYNQASSSNRINYFLCANLLQEINYLNIYINDEYIDTQEQALKVIANFEGITKELEELDLVSADKYSANTYFTNTLINSNPFPSDISDMSIAKDLQQINLERKSLEKNNSPDKVENYLYSLKSFKSNLLHKLSVELTDQSEINNIRTLLAKVNHDIKLTKDILPKLHTSNDKVSEFADTSLAKELAQTPQQKIQKLVMLLKRAQSLPPGSPTKKDITDILPSLKDYNFKKLGGGNNVNWRITNPEKGVEQVLQIDMPELNQSVINSLENTSAAKYLSTRYYASTPVFDVPYRLSLTDYAPGGDLRSERESDFNNDSPSTEIQESSLEKFSQLTALCENLLANNVAHPDIKLANFLVDSKGELVIADKKTFISINEQGNIPFSEILTTPPYAPPEYHTPNKKSELNADKYMSYQLGIALYDYLVMPEKPQDPSLEALYEEKPLNYEHEVFNNPKGQQIKELIEKMMEPDPDQRLSLKGAQQAIAKLKVPQAKENINSEVKSWKSKITNKYKHTIQKGIGRNHKGQEVNATKFKNMKLKVQEFKGDLLKSKILEDFKDKIENVGSKQELQDLKTKIKGSDEYKILKTAEGTFTKITGIKTSSEKALNEMFKEQEQNLDNQSSLGL